MTIHDAGKRLIFQLFDIYEEREATNIADWVMEKLTGWQKIDRVVNKQVPLSREQEQQLEQYTSALLTHRPVQYVLREAWFYNMKFYVDENVLIPRPETEELVEWVVKDEGYRIQNAGCRILDIGTGSGCIAIAIKNNLPKAEVWACDTSNEALTVARLNADNLHAQIDFVPLDFLNIDQHHQLPKVDIIVSNPPYIPLKDKESMAPNVLNHEPHLALFVPDDYALIFYEAMADFAKEHLHEGGSIYVEIHESLGKDVEALFHRKGYSQVTIRKDLQGKERMVKIML